MHTRPRVLPHEWLETTQTHIDIGSASIPSLPFRNTSTSCPCPTTGLGGDYVERLEGEVISVCGAGGGCEAINENWLAACRVKDQLQPKSPPRRIYNPLCCGLGSFGFNCQSRNGGVIIRVVVE